MDTTQVLQVIEERIALLTKVRALLAPQTEQNSPTFSAIYPEFKPKKRVVPAKGRANMAAAQRKRRKLAKQKRQLRPDLHSASAAYGSY
jgi:hypothetical protein